MNTKDKVFLARADAVTETHQKRIEKLQDRLAQVEAIKRLRALSRLRCVKPSQAYLNTPLARFPNLAYCHLYRKKETIHA